VGAAGGAEKEPSASDARGNAAAGGETEKAGASATSKSEKSNSKSDGAKNSGSPKSGAQSASSKNSGSKSAGTKDVEKPETVVVPEKTMVCTISIDCESLVAKDPQIADAVSKNGIILSTKSVTVKEGATAYDVLKACGVSFVGKTYISSVGGLSERDAGAKSGWLYSVNGKFPGVGITAYKVKNGDTVALRYTCNGGSDVGR
jgi:hypothetical protein